MNPSPISYSPTLLRMDPNDQPQDTNVGAAAFVMKFNYPKPDPRHFHDPFNYVPVPVKCIKEDNISKKITDTS